MIANPVGVHVEMVRTARPVSRDDNRGRSRRREPRGAERANDSNSRTPQLSAIRVVAGVELIVALENLAKPLRKLG